MIEVRGVSKSFVTGDTGIVDALKDINAEIDGCAAASEDCRAERARR